MVRFFIKVDFCLNASLIKWSIFVFIFISTAQAQTVKKEFSESEIDSATYRNLLNEYGKNKILPAGFEKQALIALSFYPELRDTEILFRLKDRRTPLETRPTLFSCLKKKENRVFIITISKQSMNFLGPILLKNLSFNAQVGVIGHELSHVADFRTKNLFQTIGIALGHLSKKYMDHFENNTDRRCIDYGLGYQLLSWSEEVREKLNLKDWMGADHVEESIEGKENRERYMSPQSIQTIIDNSSLYFKK